MEGIDGKIALVTGATDGLGREVAVRLAIEGATVIVHGRDPGRCESAIDYVRKRSGNPNVSKAVADFARFDQVQAMLEGLWTCRPRIDILVNNAGIGIEDRRVVTIDGNERVFQVNYLATCAITMGLLPLLKHGRGSRVTCVSSASQVPVDSDPNLETDWNPIRAYARSKWAQVAFTLHCAGPFAQHGIVINAVHPGDLMPTKLVLGRFPVVETLEAGVDRVFDVAAGISFPSETGTYFAKGVPSRALEAAYDAGAQRALMALTERLLSPMQLSPELAWAVG